MFAKLQKARFSDWITNVVLMSVFACCLNVAQAQTYDEVVAETYGRSCIGGTKCGSFCMGPWPYLDRRCDAVGWLEFDMDQRHFVEEVVLMAHDSVGNLHNGVIGVYADGKLVGKTAVDTTGKGYTIPVETIAEKITIKPIAENSYGTDETVVSNVKVLAKVTLGSCLGLCGSSTGNRWCDHNCTRMGDCADDYHEVCVAYSCADAAGFPHCGISPSSSQCHCDTACTDYGDCCFDYEASCN